ncbi:SDR family NAD(P)-dependent oxidoreductase [Micromonospora sp. STR1s_5]|nr:SDR family NAD(P)-dependent oxidoreductase [Micromonospora sp. STR1s_5]
MSRIAVVAGANRGIGREPARQFAAASDTVYLTARHHDAAVKTAADLQPGIAGPGQLIAHQLDVTDPGSITRLGQTLHDRHGHLDVLVNSAGILYDTWQNAASANLAVVQQAIDTNLFGAWRTTITLLPLLRASRHPRIVNVSSEGGSLTHMGGGIPAYRISKTALNALTRMLADELRHDRILVNAVCPGWVATNMGGAGGRPAADGAASTRWAADLPDSGPTGGFYRDGHPLP